ncbi:WD-REPEATS-REGION domain-containing protein [Mycena chlorophos]|uniref:WD-REPEATS-REGION domain-containing protein n=1 Tax=Mycena chlorophos TaxID=658473 RepID=A0A8H6WIL8_MYCCL|nr:WD-REPEATS-REGION domain-containing protein [Mycena chlorophos]
MAAARPHVRTAPKRAADKSYVASPVPAKRRRLDLEQKTEIERELPPDCRKGIPNCHRRRKEWITREIAALSRVGVRVDNYEIQESRVRFSYVQADITKVSLAPKTKPRVEKTVPPVDSQPRPSPSHPSFPKWNGPVRSFKSGTLSFSTNPPASPLPDQDDAADRTLMAPVEDNSVVGLLSGDKGPPESTQGSARSTPKLLAALVASPHPKSPSPLSPANLELNLREIVTLPTNLRSSPTPPPGDFVLDGAVIQLPSRQQHDKLRRLLCDGTTSSVVAVSMYGFFEGVDVKSRRHSTLTPHATESFRRDLVEDACLLLDEELGQSFTIVGHGRDTQQLSLIDNQETRRSGVITFTDLHRPWNSSRKGGVSAVAPVKQPLSFATGGYDHEVHLWKLAEDFSSATPHLLNIRHNSLVQSLLCLFDTSRKLVSAGADCCVNFYDLSSQRIYSTIRTSNSVYHVHPTPSPFCTLFEIAHREFQYEVRDHRVVPQLATQRFGCRTTQFHGRYMKGATFSEYFASGSGDREGVVRIWDLRNTEHPCCEIECARGQKIAHIVAEPASSRLLVCSETHQISVIHKLVP